MPPVQLLRLDTNLLNTSHSQHKSHVQGNAPTEYCLVEDNFAGVIHWGDQWILAIRPSAEKRHCTGYLLQ